MPNSQTQTRFRKWFCNAARLHIRTAAPLWGLIVLWGLTMLPSHAAAADGTLLFVGIFRGGGVDERVGATVLQRLAETGYSVRRPGTGSPPCQSGDCLTTLAGRQSVTFAVVGSVAKTENACTGTVFVSYDLAQKALSKTVACHAEWSEVEVAARVADDIGALLDEAKRQQRQQQATEQAKTAALSRFTWPWTWKRKLVVGAVGILLAGTTVGLGVLVGADKHPTCVGVEECTTRLSKSEDPTTGAQIVTVANPNEVRDNSKPIAAVATVIGIESAGLILTLALP